MDLAYATIGQRRYEALYVEAQPSVEKVDVAAIVGELESKWKEMEAT